MSQTYFTSDPHYGHRAIVVKYGRHQFGTIENMNDVLVDNWNAVVNDDDVVWVLGDFSLTKGAVKEIGPRLKGRKRLVAGNHDACHPMHSKRHKDAARVYYNAGFEYITTKDNIKIGGVTVTMHHMPYAGDHTAQDRYLEWRPVDRGRWLLHGHVHGLFKVRGRCINVGVDVWDYKPVHIDQIADLIRLHSKTDTFL